MGDTIVYILCGIFTEREKQLIQTPEGQRVVLEARRVFLDMDKEIRMEKPLYVLYEEVYRLVEILEEIVFNKDYENYSNKRTLVV
ncbi:Na-translocating system protein MpsC family protein [Bacillus sp. AFS031507]|uniref:Na-translocating system protein MpsC family protein n=1 Tax=Bacillus sp. AFS031507 TaxID=2033496 RepID=UPI000BFDDEAD|nr:hypothetical protein COE25_26480 [Bacillus sp. AFS031507]